MVVGALAADGSPSPAIAHEQPATMAQALSTIGAFFAGGVGLVLVRVLMSLRGFFSAQIDERINAAKLRDVEAKDGKLPQPFYTSVDDPPVGTLRFDEHRKHNTAAHKEIFDRLDAAEQKAREESEIRYKEIASKMDHCIAELRTADTHHSERLSGEIKEVRNIAGEVRASVETIIRLQTKNR